MHWYPNIVPLEPSGPALRLIELVEHLAAHPTDERTATEISRATGINRTTCLSLLLALHERRWVQRRPGNRYALGPGLVGIGEAALASLQIVEGVQPELDLLATTLDMEAIASTVSGTEIVVIAHARSSGVLSNTARVGQTIPFAPPFGLAHLVGAGTEAVEAWLDRSPHPLDDEERAEYREVLDRAAQVGVVMVLDADSRRRFEALMAELARSPASRRARQERDALMRTLARDRSVLAPPESSRHAEVSQIHAPVVGPDGTPVAAIGVHGLPHQIHAERLALDVQAVSDAARRASRRLAGDQPKRSAISS